MKSNFYKELCSECIPIVQKNMTKPSYIIETYKPEDLVIALSRFDCLPEHLEAQRHDQHRLSMTSCVHISSLGRQKGQRNDRKKENYTIKTFASSIESFNSCKPIVLPAGFSGDKFPFTASAFGELIPIAASFCIFRLTSFLLLSSSSAAISSSSPFSMKRRHS